MKFLQKRRLKSLLAYFDSLDNPAIVLSHDMQLIYSNKWFKTIQSDDLMERVVEFLFSKAQSVPDYELESSFLPQKRVHTVIFCAQKKMEESVAMGKEFIANASHELRTPITIIKGFAEAIEDIEDISKEMLLSMVKKILKSTNRMQGLVKQLLLLSDLDQTKRIEKSKCNLMDYVEGAIEDLLEAHPNTRVECFHPDDPIVMNINKDLFRLALFNVLENGVKYSRGEAVIQVIVNKNNDGIVVSIQDNGMGMDEKQSERIFKRFITVDKSHSRKLGGAGLGLSLVDLIMQKHGARIDIVSKIDNGTKIAFNFPNAEC